jgi:hypothetical protein
MIFNTSPDHPETGTGIDSQTLGNRQFQEDLYRTLEFLRQFEELEHTFADGKTGFVLVKPTGTGDAVSTCSGFTVSVNASTGAVTQDESAVSYGGPKPSYTGPVLVQDSGSNTAPSSGVTKVYTKITFSPTNQSEWGTSWELDDFEFILSASEPTDTIPEWDTGVPEWDAATGTVHTEWAKITDRVLDYSFGGGIILIMCQPDDIRVSHVCSI